MTGLFATASERRCRSARASFAWSPPTSMPSILTPCASTVGEPANAKPRTTTLATIASSKKARRRRTVGWYPGAPLEDEELDAAGDVELDAGDVRGEVGAEEGDRVRDLLRLTRPPEGGAGDDPLVHLGVRHVEGLGADDARHDRVAGDAVARAFNRKRSGQAEKPGLRRRVARLPEAAERAGDRGHVDHAAPAALPHVRPHRLGAVERAGQVDPQVALPELGRLLLELGRVVERAGVVDEDVDRPELLDRARDGRVDLGALGDVAANGECAAAEAANLLHGLLGVHHALLSRHRGEGAVTVGLLRELRLDEQVGDDDVGARARERQRVRAAEPS